MAVFKDFFTHLQKEPHIALGSIFNMGDISEGLFFYFTRLSVTACFVIAIVLVARLLLKKAPKVYSYALWVIVFLKLLFPFSISVPQQLIVPTQQINTVYDSVMPPHNFFYGETGFESTVNTDFLADAPVADPVFLPAYIWFLVFVLLIIISAIQLGMTYARIRNANCRLYKDNVYFADIATPFVLGVIKPKIYLPKNLSEIQQNYVIAHEKVHLSRLDHIVKLVCFTACCIHWFNPLVWISFIFMEKDMEMSCDEKVLDILGNGHKKDYSYCILSLATGKRFLPKAYLSFGDSDTKKRIKNVLDFKKPSLWIAAVSVIVIILAAVAALSENKNNAVFEEDVLTAAKGEFSYFHLTIEDYDSTVEFRMPKDWYFEPRGKSDSGKEYDYFPVVLVDHVYDIYNEDGIAVGAFGVTEQPYYDPYIDDVMAIYGPFALSNNFSFQVKSEDYYQIFKDEYGSTGICPVYHSPSIVHNNGGLGDAIYNKGIVSHNKEQMVIAAFEFDKNVLNDDQHHFIAASVFIEPQDSPVASKKDIAEFVYQTEQIELYHQLANRFGFTADEIKTIYYYKGAFVDKQLLLYAPPAKAQVVLDSIFSGQEFDDVVTQYRNLIADGGLDEDKTKTLTHLGYSLMDIYLMNKEQLTAIFDSIRQSNMPGGANRVLGYEEMAGNVLESYKNGTVVFDDIYEQPPEDFQYPEFIDWGKYSFGQDEMGFFWVAFPSTDNRYVMTIAIDDSQFADINGNFKDAGYKVHNVGFYRFEDFYN